MERTLALIGAGRVGTSLTTLWSNKGIVKVRHVVESNEERQVLVSRAWPDVQVWSTLRSLEDVDIVFIATPDDAISPVAYTLHTQRWLPPHGVLFHPSGALASTVLLEGCIDTERDGWKTRVASVHPARSFPTFFEELGSLSGVMCIAEGDPDARAVIEPLFAAVGATMGTVSVDQKVLYHLASVFANNGATILGAVSQELFLQAGLSELEAVRMWKSLVLSSLHNVERHGFYEGLTGPMIRGEEGTIEAHRRALLSLSPELRRLYEALYEVVQRIWELERK